MFYNFYNSLKKYQFNHVVKQYIGENSILPSLVARVGIILIDSSPVSF